jgi:hypothetical protein
VKNWTTWNLIVGGPSPSKSLAYGGIHERRKLIEDRIKISIGSIRHRRNADEKT